MKIKFCAILLLILGIHAHTLGQMITPGFIQNQGQIPWVYDGDSVLYHSQGNLAFYFTTKGWWLRTIETVHKPRLGPLASNGNASASAMDSLSIQQYYFVELQHANPDLQIQTSTKRSDFVNFYTHLMPEGRHNIPVHDTLFYQNVWPGIDIRFYNTHEQGLKYDFIVHPKGDVTDIQLIYQGAKAVVPMGKKGYQVLGEGSPINYEVPKVYELEGEFNQSLGFELVMDENSLSYNVEGWSKKNDLIIDPWATFFGNNNSSGAYAVDSDVNGDIIAVGGALGNYDVGAQPGYVVEDGTYGGEIDMAIVGLTSFGDRRFATYFGGSQDETAYGVEIEAGGDFWVTGVTYPGNLSVNDFPVGADAGFVVADANGATSREACIIKFDATGNRLFASYYGGDQNDEFKGLDVNNNGEAIVVGFTDSDDIPLAGTPYQNAISGDEDGIITLFAGNGALIYASYFGGTNEDFLGGVYLDQDWLYFVGSTRSNGLSTVGAFQPANAGQIDYILGKFDITRGINVGMNLDWATYFGGPAAEWMEFRYTAFGRPIDVDKDDNLVFALITDSDGLATANGYMTSNPPDPGTGDRIRSIIAGKFDSNGNGMDRTYFRAPDPSARGSASVAATERGDILIGGNFRTGHNYVFPAPSGGPDRTFGENYIIKFSANCEELLCGRFNNFALPEGVTRLDKDENIIRVSHGVNDFLRFAYPSPPNMVYQNVPGSFRQMAITKICSPCGEEADGLLLSKNAELVTDPSDPLVFEQCLGDTVDFCLGLDFSSLTNDSLWGSQFFMDSLYFGFVDMSSGDTLDGTETFVLEVLDGCISLKPDALGDLDLLAYGSFGSCGFSREITIRSVGFTITLDTINETCAYPASAEAQVSGTGGPYAYYWMNSMGDTIGTNALNNSLKAGKEYTLCVQDLAVPGAACEFQCIQHTPSGIEPPEIELVDSIPMTCGLNNGDLSISIEGGSPPFTIRWFDLSEGTDLSAYNNFTRLNERDSGTYQVIVDDGICKDTLEVYLGYITPNTYILDTIPPHCGENNGAFILEFDQGIKPIDLVWESFDGVDWVEIRVVTEFDTDILSGLGPGLYRYITTDSLCSDTVELLLDSIPPIELNIKSDVPAFCNSQTGSIHAGLTGGSGDFDMQWFAVFGPPWGELTGENDSLLSPAFPGEYAWVVNDGYCTDTVYHELGSQSSLQLSLVNIIPSQCETNSGEIHTDTLGVQGTLSLQWYSINNSTWIAIPGAIDLIIQNLGVGDYGLIAEDDYCRDTLRASIGNQVNFDLTGTLLEPSECCGPTGALAIEVDPDGSYQYFWEEQLPSGAWQLIPGENTDTIWDLECGTYRASVDDGFCVGTIELVVPEVDNFEVVSSSIQDAYCLSATGSIDLVVNQGSIDSIWVKPSFSSRYTIFNLPIDGLEPNSYELIMFQAYCKDTLILEVGSMTSLSHQVDVQNSSCGEKTGSLRLVSWNGIGSNINWSWKDRLFNDLGSDTGITNLDTGLYYLVLEDSLCKDTFAYSIVSLGQLRIALLDTIPPTCGVNNGSGRIEVLEQFGSTLTYDWQPGGQTTASVNDLGAGWQSVEVSDGICLQRIDFQLQPPAAPSIAMDTIQWPSCGLANGELLATATGGTGNYTYQWYTWPDLNPIAMANDPSLSGIASGGRLLRVDDGNCEVEFLVDFGSNPSVVLNILTTNPATCSLPNGFIDMDLENAIGSINYQLFDGSGTLLASQSNGLFENLLAGCYGVKASDSLSCTDSIAVCVADQTQFTFKIDSVRATRCAFANGYVDVQALGGSGNFTYNWYYSGVFIGAGSEQNDLEAGLYTLIVEDLDYGCMDSLQLNVPKGLALKGTLESITPSFCNDNNGAFCISWVENDSLVEVFLEHLDSGIQWQGPDSCYIDLPPGDYRCIIKDSVCVDTLWFNIPNDPALQLVLIEAQAPTCDENNGVIKVEGTLGTGAYMYDWFTYPAGMGPFGTTGRIEGLSEGLYEVAVFDNQCHDTLSIVLERIPAPEVVLRDSIPPSCGLNNGRLSVDTSFISGILAMQWYKLEASGDIYIGNDLEVSGLAPGDYMLIFSDENCTDTLYWSLFMVDPLQIDVLNYGHASCLDSNGYLEFITQGGIGLLQYDLSPNWAYQQSGDTLFMDDLPAGVYCVRVSDDWCSDTICFEIEDPGTMDVQGFQLEDFCTNGTGSAWVSVDGGAYPYTFNWQHDNSATDSLLDSLVAGNYEVEVLDSNGCSAVETIVVGNNRDFLPSSATIRSIIQAWEVKDSSKIIAQSGDGFWDFHSWYTMPFVGDSSRNPAEVYADSAGVFTVCAVFEQNSNGCLDTLCVPITVLPGIRMYFPNAFTPHDDNPVNEYWSPVFVGVRYAEGYIYDRWGKLMKYMEGTSDKWYGKDERGNVLKSDVYVYKYFVTDRKGKVHKFHGKVVIL